ncbi:MAG: hypothetical protein ACOVO9_04485 [Bacteroidia bacterium]
MKEKITILLENYLMQINFYQNKINSFKFATGSSNQKTRDSFLDLALYVDKLNYYQNNFNKLKVIDDFIETGVVLAEHRHKMEIALGTIDQETKTLLDFWASIQ